MTCGAAKTSVSLASSFLRDPERFKIQNHLSKQYFMKLYNLKKFRSVGEMKSKRTSAYYLSIPNFVQNWSVLYKVSLEDLKFYHPGFTMQSENK